MKELVEKINALYAEFEKDATAQAEKKVKRLVLEQEKFHSLSRRNSKILGAFHSRLPSSLSQMFDVIYGEEWCNTFFAFFVKSDKYDIHWKHHTAVLVEERFYCSDLR